MKFIRYILLLVVITVGQSYDMNLSIDKNKEMQSMLNDGIEENDNVLLTNDNDLPHTLTLNNSVYKLDIMYAYTTAAK